MDLPTGETAAFKTGILQQIDRFCFCRNEPEIVVFGCESRPCSREQSYLRLCDLHRLTGSRLLVTHTVGGIKATVRIARLYEPQVHGSSQIIGGFDMLPDRILLRGELELVAGAVHAGDAYEGSVALIDNQSALSPLGGRNSCQSGLKGPVPFRRSGKQNIFGCCGSLHDFPVLGGNAYGARICSQ
ncbi:hypothetical protein D3C75_925150 [compost metagenome]